MPASPRSAWPNGAVRPVWASNLPSPPGRPTRGRGRGRSARRGGGDGAGSPPQSDCGPRTLAGPRPIEWRLGCLGMLQRSDELRTGASAHRQGPSAGGSKTWLKCKDGTCSRTPAGSAHRGCAGVLARNGPRAKPECGRGRPRTVKPHRRAVLKTWLSCKDGCCSRTLGLIVPRAPAAGRAGELARSERPARVRDARAVAQSGVPARAGCAAAPSAPAPAGHRVPAIRHLRRHECRLPIWLRPDVAQATRVRPARWCGPQFRSDSLPHVEPEGSLRVLPPRR